MTPPNSWCRLGVNWRIVKYYISEYIEFYFAVGDSSSSSSDSVPLSLRRPVRNAVRRNKEETGNLSMEQLQRHVLTEQLNLIKLQREYYENKLKTKRLIYFLITIM